MSIIFTSYIKTFIVVSFFLITGNRSYAQSINTSVNKKDILIGEQITYTLRAELPSADFKVEIAIPDSIPHFELIDNRVGDTSIGNKYIWQQRIIFTSFDSGSYAFPQLNYTIKHLNTVSQPLQTDSFTVNVGYMPLDKDGKPRDIKTIVEVDYFNWLWVIIGGGIFLFLVFLFFLFRYLQKNKTTIPATNSLNAYKEAIQSLEQLKKANESSTITVKEYHSKLADILKIYYSKAVRKNMLNNTSEEILAKLKMHELNAITASQANEALLTGDATKFAKYHPTFTENEMALQYLKNTIEEIESLRHKKN
jgi:hypothetical protein